MEVGGQSQRGLQRWLNARSDALIPWVVASIAALQTCYLVTWSVRELTERGVAMDDSFFYAVLACNYDKIGYLTFDGTMPTNGVQPLWQWLMIGLHKAFPNVEVMSLSFLANWILYVLFCWLIVRHALRVRSDHGRTRALVVSLLLACNPAFQAIVLRGMEVPLFLVGLAALLNLLEHASQRWVTARPSAGQGILLGALAATIFLARTDWFWVVPIGALFVWKRTNQWRLVGLFGVAASLIAVPYLAHNWAVHGHMMPISGRAKLMLLDLHTTSFVDYLQSNEWHGVFSMVGGLFGLKSLWFSIPLVMGLTFIGVRYFLVASPSVRFLLVGAACHTLFMQLAYREVRPYTRYYFSAEGIVAAYVLAEVAALALTRLRRLVTPSNVAWSCYGTICAAMLLISGATLAFHTAGPRDKWVWRWQMAERLHSLPPDEKVAAFWPGVFSYVSGRPVFPLDGIVGSEAYLGVVRQGRELEYARHQGIDYVVVADLPPASVYASEPPEIATWADLGKLRLWHDCAFVKRLVAKHGNPTENDGWYLYELQEVPNNQRCRRIQPTLRDADHRLGLL